MEKFALSIGFQSVPCGDYKSERGVYNEDEVMLAGARIKDGFLSGDMWAMTTSLIWDSKINHPYISFVGTSQEIISFANGIIDLVKNIEGK